MYLIGRMLYTFIFIFINAGNFDLVSLKPPGIFLVLKAYMVADMMSRKGKASPMVKVWSTPDRRRISAVWRSRSQLKYIYIYITNIENNLVKNILFIIMQYYIKFINL